MKQVNFKILHALSNEIGEEYPIETTITILAMHDIPMSDAVIQLGVVTGVLSENYRNGWSEEEV